MNGHVSMSDDMLNLTHVRSFLAVIDTRGVRAAAKSLDLAPSTIVEHLKQLEAHLAAPLLHRRSRAALPTVQGSLFLPYARALLSTATQARELVHRPRLRIAAASNVGTYLLPAPIADFRRRFGIEVEVWIGPNPHVATRVELGQADLAAMEWWDDRPGLIGKTWLREPLVVIVPPGHRLARYETVSLDDLSGEALLGGEPGSGTGRVLREQLGPTADQLTIVPGFGSTEAVKRAVRAGLGISIVLKAAVADEVASNKLSALPFKGASLSKDIKLVSSPHHSEASPVARFLDSCGTATDPI